MRTLVTSTLKCPVDGAVLEPMFSEGSEARWICPRCAGSWTEAEAVALNDEAAMEARERRLEGAGGRIGRLAKSSVRAAPTSRTLRADSRPTTPTKEIERLIANVTPVTSERLSAEELWTFLDADVCQALKVAAPIELFYDEIAEQFDQIMNTYDLERRVDTIFDVLLGDQDLTGRTLLDAGCGTGWFSLEACRRGAKVTALDIGPRLLDQVRRKCDATTVCGDVLDLDFEDGAFDVVISSECIEHTRNPRRAVHELVRVCRPGGLIAITTPNHFWYWLCAIANKLHLRPYEGIENWPRWTEFRQWVEESGGRTLETRGIHLFPFQLSVFHPLLKFLDRFGRFHGRFCVNQAILAMKQC
ncbi:MAG TPA: methyltransferase domain-containing protein [Phycisphaerae bacterium]|nr:methyltransferase domain-containing protein [Phycisphaerae bacterium]